MALSIALLALLLSIQVYAAEPTTSITGSEQTADEMSATSSENNVTSVEEDEPEITSYSKIFVNPIYQDIISEEELAKMLVTSQNEEIESKSGLFYTAPKHTFSSLDEIASYLVRAQQLITTDIY